MFRILLVITTLFLSGCAITAPVGLPSPYTQGTDGWEFMVEAYSDKVYFTAKEAGLDTGTLPYYDKASQRNPQKLIGTTLLESEGYIDPTYEDTFYREVIDRVKQIETVGK